MTQKTGHPKQAQQPGDRFTQPETPVSERIDQLMPYCAGQESQAEWLKLTLEARWTKELPQPFIGFDEEEGAFVAEWQSDTECNTLVVDPGNRQGRYHTWPGATAGELAQALDLDTEEAWQLLRSALTATRP